MSYLERFPPVQRDLIVSLPYRVGVWISQSDMSGGDEANEAELAALQLIMMGYAEDFLKSEVVEEVMRRTVSMKHSWEQWEKSIDTVLEDCVKVLGYMEEYIRPDDILSYRQSLMEIGVTVAMAYCEQDEDEAYSASAWRVKISHVIDTIRARLQGYQPYAPHEHLNISERERAALEQLSQAIGITLDGRAMMKLPEAAQGQG